MKVFHPEYPDKEPEYDIEKIKQASNVIICRHAYSQYNKVFEDWWNLDQSDESVYDVMTDPSLRDCGLSELGVQ